MKLLVLLIVYSIIWIALSGLFDTILLSFGVFSVLLVLFVLRRMSILDKEPVKFHMSVLKSIGYSFWLLKEILKSNFNVCKIILSPKINVDQNLFNVPLEPKGEAAKVIFANSITLTPGTITVETEAKSLLVHSLDFKESTLEEIKEMGSLVSKCERKG